MQRRECNSCCISAVGHSGETRELEIKPKHVMRQEKVESCCDHGLSCSKSNMRVVVQQVQPAARVVADFNLTLRISLIFQLGLNPFK